MSCSSLLSLLLDCIFSMSNCRRLLLPLNNITAVHAKNSYNRIKRRRNADERSRETKTKNKKQPSNYIERPSGWARTRDVYRYTTQTRCRRRCVSERRAYDAAAPSSSAAAAAVELEGETVGRRRRTLRATRLKRRGRRPLRISRCARTGRGGPEDWMLVLRVQPIGRSPSGPGGACYPHHRTRVDSRAADRFGRTRAASPACTGTHIIIILLFCGVYVRVFAASACQGYRFAMCYQCNNTFLIFHV